MNSAVQYYNYTKMNSGYRLQWGITAPSNTKNRKIANIYVNFSLIFDRSCGTVLTRLITHARSRLTY